MYENMPNMPKDGIALTNVVSNRAGFDQSPVSGYGSSGSSNSSKSQISIAEPVYCVADPGIEKESIAVIGSGNFGRALALKIAQSGYHVYIGSRNPDKNRHLLTDTGITTTTIEEATANATSKIIIFAIPKDFYDVIVPTIYDLLDGKIVVDVSNRNSVHAKMVISNAEYLQRLLPTSAVVKAFNVLSAYVLESGGIQGSKEVFYAGDIQAAKLKLNDLIRQMGYIPVDRGSIRSAREIEDIPVRQFPEWKTPLVISFSLFIVFFLLAFGKFQVCWTLSWDKIETFGDNWNWKRWNTIPTTTVNSTLAVHAINMLSLCYIPGLIAAYIQLIRGTKYSRFPNWLDKWLRMRKQLGLLMLFSASLHAILSCASFSPTYHELAWGDPKEIFTDTLEGGWGPKTLVQNQTVKVYGSEKMHWRGESFLVAGVVAYALSVLLGITSLPSVTAALSWKEFAFIQSKLGWACLIFAVMHDLFYGWPYINGFSCYVPPTFQYAIYLPGLAILLKLPLLVPCLDQMLKKIRGGWERGYRKVDTSNKQYCDNFTMYPNSTKIKIQGI